jgi:hypothetical protein
VVAIFTLAREMGEDLTVSLVGENNVQWWSGPQGRCRWCVLRFSLLGGSCMSSVLEQHSHLGPQEESQYEGHEYGWEEDHLPQRRMQPSDHEHERNGVHA